MRFPELRLLWRSKTLTVVSWVFLTVFLGALGSGLWSVVLSRAFDWVSRIFLEMISFVFVNYVNILHREIGRARTDFLMILPFSALVAALICSPWFFVFIYLRQIKRLRLRIERLGKREEDEQTPEALLEALTVLRRMLLRVIVPIGIVITLLYAHEAMQAGYTRKASNFVEQSIDILAPHIAQRKVLELRAAYRSVDNAKKFYDLEDKLKTMARDARVTIPGFDSIKSGRSAS